MMGLGVQAHAVFLSQICRRAVERSNARTNTISNAFTNTFLHDEFRYWFTKGGKDVGCDNDNPSINLNLCQWVGHSIYERQPQELYMRDSA